MIDDRTPTGAPTPVAVVLTLRPLAHMHHQLLYLASLKHPSSPELAQSSYPTHHFILYPFAPI